MSSDAEAVERFASEAMETLRRQPQSVEEIAEANQRHRRFEEETPAMLERFHRADSKNRVLAAWTKSQVEQVKSFGQFLETNRVIWAISH